MTAILAKILAIGADLIGIEPAILQIISTAIAAPDGAYRLRPYSLASGLGGMTSCRGTGTHRAWPPGRSDNPSTGSSSAAPAGVA